MTSELSNCPSNGDLARFLVEDGDVLSTETHLSECEHCQRRLEELSAAPQAWCAAQEHLEELVDDELNRTSASGHSDALDTQFLHRILGPTDDPMMMGRIGAYEVCRVIGHGGTAIVFKAFDPRLNRYVAIKVLAPSLARNGSARKRFAREGKAIASVADDHVIAVHAVDEHLGLPYIVMRYVAGTSLQQRIEKNGTLDAKEVVQIALQVGRALSSTHQHGIIHRDIKPSNILLEEGVERARVGDFGLVQVADDAAMTQSGVIAGTPQYMSPEQARGEAVDGRSDLFSLGAVMYAMCTGRSPFRASTALGALRSVTQYAPKPVREINPDIPDWLDAFILKLLEKHPSDRFASADDVAACLAEELAYLSQPAATPPARHWRTEEKSPDRRRKFALLVGLGLLAGGLCVWAALLWRRPQEVEPPTSKSDFQSLLRLWAANPELAPGKNTSGTILVEGRVEIEGSDGQLEAAIRMDPKTGDWRPKASWALSFRRLPADTRIGGPAVGATANEIETSEGDCIDPSGEQGGGLGVICDSSADDQWNLWVWNSNSGNATHRISATGAPDGETRLISSGPGHARHVCFSPKADQIAFILTEIGPATLHLGDVHAQDSRHVRCDKLRGVPCALSWSPNGRELAVALVDPAVPAEKTPQRTSIQSNTRIVIYDLTHEFFRWLGLRKMQIRNMQSLVWTPEEWTPIPFSEIGDFPAK